MIKQDKRAVTKLDGQLRFEELRLLDNVNVTNINQVTAAWLQCYLEQCDKQEQYAEKYYEPDEAATVKAKLREQRRHVKHLVEIILKSRET